MQDSRCHNSSIGRARVYRTYNSSISHDDAATAVVATLKAPAGAYTVADDEPVRRAVFFASLAENLGLRPPRLLPSWTISLLGSVGETAARSLRLSNRKLKNATNWALQFPGVREDWTVILAQIQGVIGDPLLQEPAGPCKDLL